MSKIIEWIKKDKLKAATIGVSLLVFIVGIVVTAVNSGDTYAIAESCWLCSGSNGSTFGFVSSAGVPSQTCIGGEWEIVDSSNCGSSSVSEKKFTVTFDANGGTLSGESTLSCYTSGSSCAITSDIPTATRSGYTFKGWGTSNTCTSGNASRIDLSSSTTYYACWEENEKCWVCKSTVGGEEFIMFSMMSAGKPSQTCIDGEWMIGELSDCNSSSEETPTTYEISYNANGGSGEPSSQTKTHGVNLTLSSTKPTRSGYTFQGWGTSADDTTVDYTAGGTYTANASATLYAIWKINTYTVTYNANGGSGAPSSQTKTHGVNLTLSSTKPTRSGYTFQGWGTSADDTTVDYTAGGTYTANASATLYAIWKINTYTVTYNANSGSGAPSSQTKTGGTALTLSNTKPIKLGYTFDSWNTKDDGTGTEYNPGSSYTTDADLTLYAQYKPNRYKIAYTLNGGVVSGNPSSAVFDNVVTIKYPTKVVTVVGNDNKTGATIGKSNSSEQEFIGWTSSTINTQTAYHGNSAWTNGSTKTLDTMYKNLTPVNDDTVTMVANWKPVEVILPTVSKKGYNCYWNTKADGTGTDYKSADSYLPSPNSSSIVNVYAICEGIPTDDEPDENVKTGDTLIIVAWVTGIGALGYAIYYYFKHRKVNI